MSYNVGGRFSATEDGVTRYFVFDGLDVIAELSQVSSIEFQVSSTEFQVARWYVRGSGLGGGIGDVIAEVTPAAKKYYSYNHRGDMVSVTDASGAVVERNEYTAFGAPVSSVQYQGSHEVRVTSDEVRRQKCRMARGPADAGRTNVECQMSNVRLPGFSRKEHDTASGLSHYGFRYYDPASARWMNKDPSGWEGNDNNVYRMCYNNLLIYADSRGDSATAVLSATFSLDVFVPEPSDCFMPKWALHVLAVPVALAIDYVVSPPATIPNMKPPGMCTPEIHAIYQMSVDMFCKQPRRCTSGMPLDERRVRYYINVSCAIARDTINAACFAGGDSGHRIQAEEAHRAALKCICP